MKTIKNILIIIFFLNIFFVPLTTTVHAQANACVSSYNDKNDPTSTPTPVIKWWYVNPSYSQISPITNGQQWLGPYATQQMCEEQANITLVNIQNLQNSDPTPTDTNYTLLAPVSDDFKNFETDPEKTPCAFGKYLNIMIKIFIGICAVLAMIMIVVGGIEYMTSELVSEKSDGKTKITGAVFGLILALGSYAILNTINPTLLETCLDHLPEAEVESILGESTAQFQPIEKTILGSLGINCPETGGSSQIASIAQSFKGKATYSMTKRNTYDGSVPTAYFDCSSYVAQVYSCAGLSTPGNNTGEIFGTDTLTLSGTKANGVELAPGDLLGWKAGEDTKSKYGHVVMYLGNGDIIDSHGPEEVINKSVGPVKPLSFYAGRYKHIKLINSGVTSTTPTPTTIANTANGVAIEFMADKIHLKIQIDNRDPNKIYTLTIHNVSINGMPTHTITIPAASSNGFVYIDLTTNGIITQTASNYFMTIQRSGTVGTILQGYLSMSTI